MNVSTTVSAKLFRSLVLLTKKKSQRCCFFVVGRLCDIGTVTNGSTMVNSVILRSTGSPTKYYS